LSIWPESSEKRAEPSWSVHRATHQEVTVRLRIDMPIEVDYYKRGGILPFELRQLLAS